jgi:cytochrome c-type biogenesis protein CcmH/NrfG
MRVDSLMFALAGVLFGLIVGWIIGSQQAGRVPARAPVAQAAPADANAAATQQRQPAVLDEGKIQALQTIISSDPKNAEARVQLANTYFDAERYDDAIKWYEEALRLNPRNVNARTSTRAPISA